MQKKHNILHTNNPQLSITNGLFENCIFAKNLSNV
jgi:hypothetical protein